MLHLSLISSSVLQEQKYFSNTLGSFPCLDHQYVSTVGVAHPGWAMPLPLHIFAYSKPGTMPRKFFLCCPYCLYLSTPENEVLRAATEGIVRAPSLVYFLYEPCEQEVEGGPSWNGSDSACHYHGVDKS